MQRSLRVFLAAVLLLALWPASLAGFGVTGALAHTPVPIQPVQDSMESPRFVEGELLVRFRDDARPRSERVHADARARAVQRIGGRTERVRLAIGQDVEGMRRWYERQPGVVYAEPNYLARKAAVPNDPDFPQQWGLRNIGQNVNGMSGTPGADIAALGAWDRHTGSAEVVVALVDSGIDHTHPELAGNLWRNPDELPDNGIDDDGNGKIDDLIGWNFVSNNNDPMDDDNDGGHGTHVAGIIGAMGDNGVGIAGVNWRVSLMALKVLDANGFGQTAAIVAAIDYAVDKGAHVINVSIAYRCGEAPSLSERDALQRARDAGVLVVIAAGNAGCNNDATPTYPASHALNNLLAVGATDPFDQRAVFPRGGSSSYGAQRVHLFAPGRNIYSTLIFSRGGYGYESGTSMAAPHVSGAAALLKAHRPSLEMRQIREILLLSARPRPALDGLAVTGARLDLAAAMDYDLRASRPVQPSHLTATQSGGNRIDLVWLDDSTIANGWKVERRAHPDHVFAAIATLDASVTTYRDEATLIGEGTYNGYRVRAFNALGDSSPGNEVKVVTPPLAPDDLQAAGTGLRVRLTWRDRSQRETGYRVERATGSGLFREIASLPADSTHYEDGTVAADTEYRYRVRTHHTAAGFSGYSPAVAITPRASADGGTKVGCFVATAAYGSAMHPRVEVLRRLRDRHLVTHAAGRAFVEIYYRWSPPLADVIARHESLRALARVVLWPLVWLAETLVPDADAGSFLAPQHARPATEDEQAAMERVERQILVRFDDSTPTAMARQMLAEQGAIRIERIATSLYVAEFADPDSARRGAAQLRTQAIVRYVELNRLVSRPRPY
jgi:subtilisin family serine protease